MEFGRVFEQRFINQGYTENRTIEETLDLGWELLSMLPREQLDRVDEKCSISTIKAIPNN